MVIKIDFGSASGKTEKFGMAFVTASLGLVRFMPESHHFFPLAKIYDSLWCGNRPGMAAVAISPGKRFFPVMTGEAVPVTTVVRHADPGGPLFGYKQRRMTTAAGLRVLVMRKCHAFGGFSQINVFSKRRHLFGGHLGTESQMTTGTLGVGGKGRFTVVTGAAIFSLVQGVHDEIFVFLGLQRFHLKQAAVAGGA